MAGNALNIVVGPGTISINGTDCGYTKDGISVRLPREYLEVKADQNIGVVKMAKTLEQLFVKTTLLEATLPIMRWAWDQQESQLGAEGDTPSTVNEVAIVLTGPAPNGATRTITLPKCVAQGDAELTWSRETETGLEVEFQALKDEDGSFGSMGGG